MPASVLVVDDNLKIQKMLGDLFSFDFDVVGLASDGHEAVEQVAGADPDVVVVDYMMPGLDGIETAAASAACAPTSTSSSTPPSSTATSTTGPGAPA